jgi:ABC-type multidrug transport system ATPase subunit
VALVGHSGAGKSTIAQLVPRLYDPHAGAVLIDGYDIRGFTLESLRAQISMVLQETLLLRGTVAENIAYGREGATPDEVVRAAQQANAHDFIMELPNGYDTVLGERAATLSGGQRQRLAIARAFIRNAPILVLDEPTTGLDAVSAALVADSLQLLARNRTTLIVSHDLNLIRSVDRVLVISAGRVFEDGSPEDLLASGGLYADLYAHQFGEAAAAAAAGPAGDGAGEAAAADLAAALPESDQDLEVVGAQRWDAGRMDTVLAQVMPQPATREQFLAMTGWIPTVSLPAAGQVVPTQVGPPTTGVPVPGEVDLDPLRSPRLTQALPGLAEALDRSAMAPRLQRMLADDWELRGCAPGKVLVQPGEGATLQYRLELRRRGAGETEERLVAGRLFASVETAERWWARLEPRARRLEGRGDLVAFTSPALRVGDLGLVLHAFPLDPALPSLARATDPAELIERLGPMLKSSLPGLQLQGCQAEVVRYRPGTCVLRYELAWQLQPSRRSLKQVVYGKVYGDGRGQLVGPAVTALRQRMDGASPSLPFLVPRFRGYLPDLQLVLLEAVAGSPLLKAMIRAQLGAPGVPAFPGPTPEGAVAACAHIAAALHGSSIPVGPPRTLAEEVDGLRAAVEALAPMAPALATSLHRHLDGIGDVVREPAGPLGVAHGDFSPSQVLFDGVTTSIVDFDTVCLAEPALDLGQFSARLAVVLRTAPGGSGASGNGSDLESVFLREYLRLGSDGDRDDLLPRVAAYRTVALARLAVRSWCQLKPQRLRPVLGLLDDPPRIRIRVP